MSYYKQGQYEKAAAEFEALVRQDPRYEAGYRVLGDIYLKLRRFEEAARAFHKAAELDAGKFVSFHGAALAEFNLGRYEDCVKTLGAGAQTAASPREKYQLHHLRGLAYYNLRRFAEAARDLEAAVSIQGSNFEDLLHLGIARFQLGDLEGAEEVLRRAAAIRPDSAEAKEYLARLRYLRGVQAIRDSRYAEAETHLQEAVRDLPGDAAAWYNLGLAQLFQDKLDAALGSFRKSAELDASRWETFERLGFIQEKREKYEAALQHYSKALELNPGDPRLAESVKRVQERIRRKREGLES
ncbi:MAG: hypothetical protein Kow00109_00430 [Acidobacteriota bacterium]